jgi:hypothetical protein
MAYHLEVTAGDEADLRSKIATAASSGQTVLVPAGTYNLTAPISVVNQAGLHILGAGPGGPGAYGGGKTVIQPAPGSLAAFVNLPVIELRGVHSAKLEKLRINNGSQASTTGVIINSTGGWASSNICFDNVYFECTNGTGVSTNNNGVNLTNSEIVFYRCTFKDSNIGLTINNGQALNYYLNQCHFDQLVFGVRVIAGGCVAINGGATNSVDTLLYLDPTAGGNNGGLFTIRDVRLEYSGKIYRYGNWVVTGLMPDGSACVIRMDGCVEAGTSIDGGKPLNDGAPAMFNLNGDIRAFVTAHLHRDRPYVKLEGNARYYDDGSTWWNTPATLDSYTGDYKRIAVKHPFGGFSNPLNEFTVLSRGTNLQDFKAIT